MKLRSFVLFSGISDQGGCRSPKKKEVQNNAGVSEICNSNSSFTSRDISLSSSSNGRDELHVLHGVAEQQRSLEDDLV